jgi:hypothetical protein
VYSGVPSPYARIGWMSTFAGLGSIPNHHPGALPPGRVFGYAGTVHVMLTDSTRLPLPSAFA